MQISRHQPSVPAPRPAATTPGPAEPSRAEPTRAEPTRAGEAPAAARAAQGAEGPPRPLPSEPEPPASSLRARLGHALEGYAQRLDGLAAGQSLSPEQALALDEVKGAFLHNLQRLAQAHLEEGAPSRALGTGFSKVLESLSAATQEALGGSRGASGSASPSERIAAVQQSFAARLQSLMAKGDMDPRMSSALEQLAGHVEHLFERFSGAVEQGGLEDPRQLREMFERLMGDLQQNAHALLGGASGTLYSPSGAIQSGDVASGQLERLA